MSQRISPHHSYQRRRSQSANYSMRCLVNQSLNSVHQTGQHNQFTKILKVFCPCFTHCLSFCDCSVGGYFKQDLFTVSNRHRFL